MLHSLLAYVRTLVPMMLIVGNAGLNYQTLSVHKMDAWTIPLCGWWVKHDRAKDTFLSNTRV